MYTAVTKATNVQKYKGNLAFLSFNYICSVFHVKPRLNIQWPILKL